MKLAFMAALALLLFGAPPQGKSNPSSCDHAAPPRACAGLVPRIICATVTLYARKRDKMVSSRAEYQNRPRLELIAALAGLTTLSFLPTPSRQEKRKSRETSPRL